MSYDAIPNVRSRLFRIPRTIGFVLGLVITIGVADDLAASSNLVVDGNVRYQRIDGAGPNINADVWYAGAGAAAIDLWRGTGAATLFRVVYEPTDWVSSQSLIASLHNLDAATLDAVYNQNPRM